DQHDLVVTGAPGAHFLIGGIRREPGGVPDRGREDAGREPERLLGAPEAAESEDRGLHAGGERRRQRPSAHVVGGGHGHPLRAAGQRGLRRRHRRLVRAPHGRDLRAHCNVLRFAQRSGVLAPARLHGRCDMKAQRRVFVLVLLAVLALATREAGKSAAGISIKREGTLALVANRSEGTVSVFTISGKTVTPVGRVTIADEKSGTSHVTFTPDGTMALVTRDGDNKISVLSIDGTKVEYTKRDINAGLRPYGIDVSSKGDFAAVANIGLGQGDTDTVSLLAVRARPPRVVETVSVGQTPEGIKVSPDGRHVAVVVMNGSNKAKESPFYADHGKLVVLRAK